MAKSRKAKAAQDAAETQAAGEHHDGPETLPADGAGGYEAGPPPEPGDAGADLPTLDVCTDGGRPWGPEGGAAPARQMLDIGRRLSRDELRAIAGDVRPRHEAARVRVDDAVLDAKLAELSAGGWELVQALRDDRFGPTDEVGPDGRKTVGHIAAWILFVRRLAP